MQRRSLLYVFAALTLLVIALTYVFSLKFKPVANAGTESAFVDVSIQDLPTGEARRYEAKGKRFYVLHRNQRQIESLTILRPTLRDPDSKEVPARHPSLENEGRSPKMDFLVVETLPSHTTCHVLFGASTFHLKNAQTWAGGFYETCQRAGYDVAGRVFSTSPKDAKNLQVLRYEIKGDTLRVFLN